MSQLEARHLNQMAVAAGRQLESAQSSYLHYYYHDEEGPYDTIPIRENILFVLALCRSRVAEQVQEAKQRLKSLLAFQTDSGNFPVYLHQYPHCVDRLAAISILPPLIIIQKTFASVLGEETRSALRNAIDKTMRYCRVQSEELNLPCTLKATLGAVAVALGENDWGQPLLDQAREQPKPSTWFSPEGLSQLLIAQQLVPDQSWPELWEHLNATYHRKTGSYVGPAMVVYQRNCKPAATLYHYTMAYLTGALPKWLQQPHPCQLELALIQPSKQELPKLELP